MQIWIPITILGHFLNALTATIDKHLVSNTKLKPTPYAFYSGIFQFSYLLVIPIIAYFFPESSFVFPSWPIFLLTLFTGAIFILALVFLYKAINLCQVSRVTPIVGISVPVFTLILSSIFLREYLTFRQLIAFVFFIIGGFIISTRLKRGKIYCDKGLTFAILAGFIFALHYVIASFAYKNLSFWNVFIIIQFGNFIGAVLLLISKKNRDLILKTDKKPKKEKSRNYKIAFFFTLDKVFAILATILIHYAISIGSVTIIQALQATQYVFVIIITFILSKKLPKLFKENTDYKTLIQKFIAIIFISIGLYLIA